MIRNRPDFSLSAAELRDICRDALIISLPFTALVLGVFLIETPASLALAFFVFIPAIFLVLFLGFRLIADGEQVEPRVSSPARPNFSIRKSKLSEEDQQAFDELSKQFGDDSGDNPTDKDRL